jgi:cobalt-zinc-cadmium efflux system membrane fusion protein
MEQIIFPLKNPILFKIKSQPRVNILAFNNQLHMYKEMKIILILFTCIMMQDCNSKKEQSPIDKPFELSSVLQKNLKLSEVKKEDVHGQLLLNGKVSALENKMVKVSPLVDGVIQTLNVSLGDYVKQGQTLSIIKSKDVDDVENQIVGAKATLRTNQKNLAVIKDMERLGLAAEKDIILSQNEVLRAKGEVKRATQLSDLYDIKNASYTMKAPISGYVVDKNPALSTQLAFDNAIVGAFYTIADLTEMQVIADVYEADIENIHVGDQVQINILAFPNEVFKGKIQKIQDIVDPITRTMKVRINIPNPDTKLKPDMFAQVIVDFDESKKLVSVPTDALIFDNSKYFAVLYHSNKNIEIREVHVYQEADGITYLKNGLNPGDKIIVSDQLIIYNAITGSL